MPQKRLIYLDIAAGIMTIWVMVFHALCPMYGTDQLKVVPWFYYFMPWFFYKAGMMFHPKDMKTEIHNGWKKLIVTYLIWTFIGWLAHIGWHFFAGDLTPRIAFYTPIRALVFNASAPINGPLWFLPILFLVRIIGNWFLGKRIRVELVVLISVIGILFCKLLNWRFMPTYFSGTCWGLFFFSMAYWLQGKETNKWIVFFAALLFIASLFTDIPSVYSKSGTPLIQALWYPACVAGCITFNNVCRGLAWVGDMLKNKWAFCLTRYVGRNALNFYVPHGIIFYLSNYLIIRYKGEWYNTWQGLCIVLAAYAVILPIINLIINRVHAKC